MNPKRLVIILFVLLLPSLAFAQTTTTGNQRQVRTYAVNVTANVRGAAIYVDGALQRATTPATLNLRAGSYEIRVESDGYRPWIRTVAVNNSVSLRAQLVRPFATVRLEVPREFINYETRNPENQILFYIDDQVRRGAEIQIQSGYHRIAIVSGGLRFEGDVFFEAGMEYTLELILRLNLIQGLQMQER